MSADIKPRGAERGGRMAILSTLQKRSSPQLSLHILSHIIIVYSVSLSSLSSCWPWDSYTHLARLQQQLVFELNAVDGGGMEMSRRDDGFHRREANADEGGAIFVYSKL
jgi:hypothetical protein